MMNSKILIFGVSGFLGSKLKTYFPTQTIIAPTHQEINLLEIDETIRFIEKNEPEIIIYAAGITKIDFAEKHKQVTNKLNHTIPKNISRFASNINSKFIYLSTDAVFDGYKDQYIFSESDVPRAKTVYGITKLNGETAVLSNNSTNTVIRFITLYGIDYSHPNFLTRIFTDLKNNKQVYGIIDQIQNPLFVEIAAQTIAYTVHLKLNGIYHAGSLDYESNYHFLVSFADKFNLNHSLIQKITFSEFFGDANKIRKKNSVLLCNKFNQKSNKKILQSISSSLDSLYTAYKQSQLKR